MNKLIINIIIYAVTALLIFGGGMYTNSKLQRPIELKCPECPDLKCPPNVSVNTLNLDEVRKLKIRGGFVYSPVFNGDVQMVVEKDTIK